MFARMFCIRSSLVLLVCVWLGCSVGARSMKLTTERKLPIGAQIGRATGRCVQISASLARIPHIHMLKGCPHSSAHCPAISGCHNTPFLLSH